MRLFTFEEAKALTYADRSAAITQVCAVLDSTPEDSPHFLRLYESMEALSCAHGTCGHYTCTQGQDLYEWEQMERLRGNEGV